MTSKEALKKIYNTGANMVIDTPLDNFFKEEVKAIAKDLEVLQILKDSITDKEAHMIVMKDEITEEMKGEELIILHYTIKGTEKVKKVKGWLNDKQRSTTKD